MLFSGIDLHKRSVAIHTLDAEGTVVRAANLPTQRSALIAYFGNLPGPHRAVVECTGMWYWLRDLLVPQGIDLRLGHAKYLKAISYAKVKTDAVDAATLAQLLRVDLIPEAHMISAPLRETRDLLRARLVLVSRRLRCQRSVGALLEKYNVATPTDLPELPRLEAALHAEQHTLLQTQVRRIEHQLRDRVLPTPDAQRLVWIPGIGALVAYTLLLEIDDITRFPTVRQFHSYCRLVPGANDSAATRRHKRSRDGNRYLKLAFHHAAVRAAQYCPEIQAEYRRLVRRKGKAIARALIAKELGSIVYYVLTRQEKFNGRFRGLQLTRTKPQRWPRLASPPT
jgi:transposase